MNLSVLGIGFAIGVQHAFEADHVAAMSSIITRRHRLSDVARHGAFWGMGHTLTLIVFAGSAISLSWAITDRWSALLELCVGFMLVGLGMNVLRRIWQGQRCSQDRPVAVDCFQPAQIRRTAADRMQELPWQTFLVGMVHGLAGSASVVVLAAATLQSPDAGLLYVGLFGMGSILGMVVLSSLISLPLGYTTSRLTAVNRALRIGIGLATVCIGVSIIQECTVRLIS